MKCKNCGNKLRTNEYICPDCGTYNTLEDEWEETTSTVQKVESKPKEEIKRPEKHEKKAFKEKNFQIEDSSGTKKNQFSYEYEDLLEAYIGEDYKLIKKSPFNIWAFLFNWVYFLYRKLYITGIIGLILTWLVIILFQKYIWIYVAVISVVLGLSFSKYYIFIAKRRVEKIRKRAHNEMDDDKFTIANTCREKGGVNVVRALVIYFIFLIIVFLCLVPISINTSYNTKFWNENAENSANCTTVVKSAYSNVAQEKTLGTIEEAVCKVIKQDKKEYEVYIKTSVDSQEIYSYYVTDDGNLFLQNRTTRLEALRTQKENGTISLEDEQLLSELEVIPVHYQKIYDQSIKDDKLIKTRKNKEEKLNFIFEKGEIIR